LTSQDSHQNSESGGTIFAMLISPESPLRSSPSALDKKQLRMLIGIRYSIDMYEVAYANLYNLLDNHVPYAQSGEEDQTEDGVFPAVFLQAWSMIDSANRLKLLLQHTPGLPRRDSAFKEHYRKLDIVKKLRNPIQHLNKETSNRAEDVEAEPVWGSLSWGRLQSTEPLLARVYLMIPGAIEHMNRPLKNIVGQQFVNKIDHIELTAYGSTVPLSEIFRVIAKFTTILENWLQAAYDADERLQDRFAADLIVSATLVEGT
jgi:hypothetical protein